MRGTDGLPLRGMLRKKPEAPLPLDAVGFEIGAVHGESRGERFAPGEMDQRSVGKTHGAVAIRSRRTDTASAPDPTNFQAPFPSAPITSRKTLANLLARSLSAARIASAKSAQAFLRFRMQPVLPISKAGTAAFSFEPVLNHRIEEGSDGRLPRPGFALQRRLTSIERRQL